MRCSVFAIAGFAVFAIAWLPLRLSAGDEPLSVRRSRVEQLTDAQKTRLLEKKQKFDGLEPFEKKQYRRLHLDLVNDPQYEKLRGTLQRYHDWLKTLTPLQRAELSKLPTKERMARVEQLMDDQAKERFRLMLTDSKALHELLSAEDRNVICKWTDKFLINHKDEILAVAPEHPFIRESSLDELRNRFDPQKHVHMLRFIYFRAGQGPFPKPPPPDPNRNDRKGLDPRKNGGRSDSKTELLADLPTPEEEDDLAGQVSQQAQNALKKATEEGERSRIIQNWMRAAGFSRFMPPISPKDLDRFVDSLDDSEREWLEALPRDRMYAELRRLYFRKGGRWSGRSGRRGGGFGPGGREGASGREGGPGGREGGSGGRDGGPGGRQGGPGGREGASGGREGGRSGFDGTPRGPRSGSSGSQNRRSEYDRGDARPNEGR